MYQYRVDTGNFQVSAVHAALLQVSGVHAAPARDDALVCNHTVSASFQWLSKGEYRKLGSGRSGESG